VCVSQTKWKARKRKAVDVAREVAEQADKKLSDVWVRNECVCGCGCGCQSSCYHQNILGCELDEEVGADMKEYEPLVQKPAKKRRL
jgi:hypothetical protein